ncbi:hypothetical protein C8034_v008008 [Colletotrichum sidae]|uniref:Uncharacterized protein n=1 Tax=Colletotrichum sidae TaxID=1347389 RepID=A0A4R8TS79_9PEZI|nr:hypothetical protein C8034_v008008 [Colletotrichum sidae]
MLEPCWRIPANLGDSPTDLGRQERVAVQFHVLSARRHHRCQHPPRFVEKTMIPKGTSNLALQPGVSSPSDGERGDALHSSEMIQASDSARQRRTLMLWHVERSSSGARAGSGLTMDIVAPVSGTPAGLTYTSQPELRGKCQPGSQQASLDRFDRRDNEPHVRLPLVWNLSPGTKMTAKAGECWQEMPLQAVLDPNGILASSWPRLDSADLSDHGRRVAPAGPVIIAVLPV